MKKSMSLLLALVIVLCPFAASLAQSTTVLTCWVYYNGAQAQKFERLLMEFNDTIGLEEGIYIEARSLGGVNELADQVIASARQEVGAEPLPDLFASYADTGYQMLQMGVAANLIDYLTPDELSAYIDAYVEEGRLGDPNGFYIFPVAKSTELLLINRTAWDVFAAETGADEVGLETWEGIVALSRAYFEWTDAKTPDVDGDGSAFFGRDAMANYMLTGGYQLDSEIFEVTNGVAMLKFDRAAMRRLWDCFYVPFASGWFAANGRFRSDDIKTGQIIALVGSTSGALYFPDQVTNDDGSAYAIESSVRLLPNFEGTNPVATQQGAGFMVAKSTPERERAAVTFLKWFTEPQRNIEFSLGSGYLPVTLAANDPQMLADAMESSNASGLMRQIIGIGSEITTKYTLYTNKPFANGTAVRAILEDTLLSAAREAAQTRARLMAGGSSYAEAVAQVTAEECFDTWYSATQAALEQTLAE